MNDLIEFIGSKFEFFSKCVSKNEKLENQLKEARMNPYTKQYLSFCFGISLITSITLLIVTLLINPNLMLLAFAAFAGVYFYVKNYPKKRSEKIASMIEKELPNVLRTIAIELKIGVQFNDCIKSIADGNYQIVSAEFKQIIIEVKNGQSMPRALESFSRRTNSLFVKHSVSQLITAYEKGSKQSEALEKLADAQMQVLNTKLKEYSNKVMIYSLMIVTASAILPTMFQAIIIVGSSFLSLNISPQLALAFPAVVFPMINIALFLVMKSKRP